MNKLEEMRREYHPISTRDQSRFYQFGKKGLPVIFLGHELNAGGEFGKEMGPTWVCIEGKIPDAFLFSRIEGRNQLFVFPSRMKASFSMTQTSSDSEQGWLEQAERDWPKFVRPKQVALQEPPPFSANSWNAMPTQCNARTSRSTKILRLHCLFSIHWSFQPIVTCGLDDLDSSLSEENRWQAAPSRPVAFTTSSDFRFRCNLVCGVSCVGAQRLEPVTRTPSPRRLPKFRAMKIALFF